ncbi:MAG: NAD-dependent epimerase/dehydratase family protein [Puniceicoccaceae bacterium]|nr:MAG: NAD-dependent epimerase/dehydratase family protein [Puniceicoccaceae bacterium]
MRVLLTGAAGFIGSHLSEALYQQGHDLVLLDNFDPFYDRAAKEANLAGLRDRTRVRLVEADIRELDQLRRELQPPFDAIIHLAARAGVRPSIEEPILYQEVNVRGTQNLLELAREWKVPHFVFASSSSVYGVNPNVPWREDNAVLKPISPYASTKVSGELLGHVYSHLFGIRFIALRFFTVYGPRQRPDLAIHKFFRLLREDRSIPFFGDGSTRRDYTFVADTVAGIIGALNYSATPFEVINLGNDRTVSLADLVAAIERAAGASARLDKLPEQPGDVPQTWADISKARRLLGYAPATTLEDGLAGFRAWFDRRG